MKPTLTLLTALLLAPLAALHAADVLAKNPTMVAGKRPNIIVILSDDMGFSDLGCYGSEIQTPNLDGLAAGGLRFTQFYNTTTPPPSPIMRSALPVSITRRARSSLSSCT